MVWFQALIQIHSKYSYTEPKTFGYKQQLSINIDLFNVLEICTRRGSGLIYSGSDSGFTNHSESGPKIRPSNKSIKRAATRILRHLKGSMYCAVCSQLFSYKIAYSLHYICCVNNTKFGSEQAKKLRIRTDPDSLHSKDSNG